jgi:CBS domain-containing protein
MLGNLRGRVLVAMKLGPIPAVVCSTLGGDLMQSIKAFLDNPARKLCTIGADKTVWDALALMATHNIGAMPVVDQGKLVGIFSERDYARRVELKGLQTRTTLIASVMTQGSITIGPEQTMEQCMAIMTEKRIRHLPVVAADQLIGMVSIGDVVFAMMAEQKQLIEQLQHYITS